MAHGARIDAGRLSRVGVNDPMARGCGATFGVVVALAVVCGDVCRTGSWVSHQDRVDANQEKLDHEQGTHTACDSSHTERAMALVDSHALSNGLQLGDALIAATALEHGRTLGQAAGLGPRGVQALR